MQPVTVEGMIAQYEERLKDLRSEISKAEIAANGHTISFKSHEDTGLARVLTRATKLQGLRLQEANLIDRIDALRERALPSYDGI